MKRETWSVKREKGFTLVEVLIAFAIFAGIMTLVLVSLTGAFRSLHKGQALLTKEQRQRMCLLRLSKEVASFTRIVYPQVRFKGQAQSFFLSMP